jgi:hypothetical protein
VWAVIFKIGIYSEILYYFIYPAYLGSWYCLKGFLPWPLVGTEKVGMRSSGPSGYSVGSHLYILCFVILRDAVPWLVQCRLPFVSDLSIHGWLYPLAIWQLKAQFLNYSCFHGGCGIQVFQVWDFLGASAWDSPAR